MNPRAGSTTSDARTAQGTLFELPEVEAEDQSVRWSEKRGVVRPCDALGLCNPCDINVKTNRFQQFGHTSVDIRFQGEED